LIEKLSFYNLHQSDFISSKTTKVVLQWLNKYIFVVLRLMNTPMKQPPRWKFAVMVWIAIYPTITTTLFLIGPFVKDFPLPLRTLTLTLIMVPLMVFVLMPFLQKLLAKWLFK
jgi:antibiotic biosynthesis monooxygenase (ABM) superfamily enzyme